MIGTVMYNKTALQEYRRALAVRVRILPTLKSRESALRGEVAIARAEEALVARERATIVCVLEEYMALWAECPRGAVSVARVDKKMEKRAGVQVPVVEKVLMQVKTIDEPALPEWLTEGLTHLKMYGEMTVLFDVACERVRILESYRRKATQKVNLYEKVQIPALADAVRRIQRRLEDEENLGKAAQKILKARLAREAEVL